MNGRVQNIDAIEIDLASFRRHLRALGRAQTTVKDYVNAVRRFYAFMECDGELMKAGDVRPDDVRQFIGHLLDTRSPASANHHANAVRTFFRFLAAEGAIGRSPAENVPAPRVRSEPAAILDLGEIGALLRACRGSRFDDRRDLAMLRVFVSTGARRFEVVNLRVNPLDYGDSDLDLDRAAIRFRGKGGMGRFCSLDSDTVRAIERYMRMRRQHAKNALPDLWLTRQGGISRNGMHRILKRRAESAGVKGFHLHRIRHTFAHEWLKSGGNEGDLMRVMGWRSREMVDHYAAGVAEERAVNAARKFSMSLGL